MRFSLLRRTSRLAVLAALAVAGLATSTGFASATPANSGVSLNGDWAPYTRCPVDSPAMLAADGADSIPQCLSSTSSGGTITLGNTTMEIGRTNLQLGLVEDSSNYSYAIVPPAGGALVADPVQVPGGLLGLMCPSDIPVISDLCEKVAGSSLNSVTATVESAGAPTDFNLAAGAGVGKPIVTIPVKIHLSNPLLGSTCYIGTNDDPILLRPRNLTAPQGSVQHFDGDGTPDPQGPMFAIKYSHGTQGDDTFAVPGAHGCGPFGLVNWAVNLKEGLPSASGNNSLTLQDASTGLAGLLNPRGAAPDAGKKLASYWHSAVQ